MCSYQAAETAAKDSACAKHQRGAEQQGLCSLPCCWLWRSLQGSLHFPCASLPAAALSFGPYEGHMDGGMDDAKCIMLGSLTLLACVQVQEQFCLCLQIPGSPSVSPGHKRGRCSIPLGREASDLIQGTSQGTMALL